MGSLFWPNLGCGYHSQFMCAELRYMQSGNMNVSNQLDVNTMKLRSSEMFDELRHKLYSSVVISFSLGESYI